MLSTQQKKEIRGVNCGDFYQIDRDGNPVNTWNKGKTVNPELSDLRRQLIQRLTIKGYTVNFVKPHQANCIIRVHKSEKAHYGEKYRIFGGNCFTKDCSTGKWRSTTGGGDDFELDFTKCMRRIWFFQDDYWDVELDFFDTYVKLIKEV